MHSIDSDKATSFSSQVSLLGDSNFTSHVLTLAVKPSHLEFQMSWTAEAPLLHVFSCGLCAAEHPPRAISVPSHVTTRAVVAIQTQPKTIASEVWGAFHKLVS